MVKKLILLAIVIIVAIAIVKGIPWAIEKERNRQAEEMMEKEDYAQKKAEEIVNQGSENSDRPIGNLGLTKKARSNAAEANNRSADLLNQMEEDGSVDY